ncbi:toll/interleukin-1 receptor domain-containing protein [Paractinoplanes toevensis]|uniref:TIR domain-containing protein n=1 Tax=Paractinoplanes toevensis TaxID=571911 RepID=A0A919W362_9ACTN|nr:toll/interleukin-1 receptor domain-containing protein [Actinoplanes toevensis]GIM92434.1 hypothetical protein Ato02nite_042270 [Actinoplanes toevensis]
MATRLGTVGALAACLAAAGVELWLGITRSPAPDAQWTAGLAMGLLFVASGTAARLLRPSSQIGHGLSAMSLVTIANDINTTLELPSTMPGRALTVAVGVPAFWMQVPLSMHLILSYPRGRNHRPREQLAVRAATVAAAVISVLLLLTKTPVPLCAQWCGPSPFQLIADPGLYLTIRGAALLVMAGICGYGLVLLLRRTVVSPRERRRSAVTAAVAVLSALLFTGIVAELLAAYVDGGRLPALEGLYGLILGTLLVAAIPLLFVAGLTRQWLAFKTMGSLAGRAEHIDPGELETAMVRATGDPALRIAYRAADGWRDACHRPYHRPADLTVQRIGEPPRAALIHTPALAEETGLIRSVLALMHLAFPPPENRKPEPQPVPHAFVSYLREDSDAVDRLVADLRSCGITVWLDRTEILPGDRWAQVIKKAICDGGFFIACFSPAYAHRDKTHMNEELTIAVDELRKRPRDRRWFLPVLLEPCALPDRDLGGGESLDDLHHVDLSQDWESAVRLLVHAIMGSRPEVPTALEHAPGAQTP